VKNWLCGVFSWDGAPVLKGKRARHLSQVLSTFKLMDFDLADRNKDWNVTIMNILPFGYKPKKPYPWLELLFTELAENKVWVMTSCADTPAMSDLLSVMGHASSYGCPYAWHKGKSIPHRAGMDWIFEEKEEADKKTSHDYEYYGAIADISPAGEEHFHGFKGSTPLIVSDKSAADRISPCFAHAAGYGVIYRFFLRLFKGQRPITAEKYEAPAPPKQGNNQSNAAYAKAIAKWQKKCDEAEQKADERYEQRQEYNAQNKMWKIATKFWPSLDQEWLDFCRVNGYITTAVPFAGVGNMGSRMTEEENIRYKYLCQHN